MDSRIVYVAQGASRVPESAAVTHRTVSYWPHVVVAVMRAEHCTVAVAKGIIPGITRVPGHLQLVVVCLGQDYECTVLGIVPFAVVKRLQVELQLEATGQCQVTEQFVAQPVVASGVVETDFKLRPRTIEEVEPVDVLLDQQRDAVGCRTCIDMSKLMTS